MNIYFNSEMKILLEDFGLPMVNLCIKDTSLYLFVSYYKLCQFGFFINHSIEVTIVHFDYRSGKLDSDLTLCVEVA